MKLNDGAKAVLAIAQFGGSGLTSFIIDNTYVWQGKEISLNEESICELEEYRRVTKIPFSIYRFGDVITITRSNKSEQTI
ncbi:hypothetical protein F4V43_01715 [Paenibacillus spiritus]|uniref:Uncharacterized protein n=1 Tax=Paenibacillus spiritus TaxID=2496557 RepID=A0A5J5GGU0_9BACL|nr:hypothetical protein [Paenibacillus spiritus]KAA9007230.1 hypothetical protein F4V43_01715 [Paenibacillus spiritus]